MLIHCLHGLKVVNRLDARAAKWVRAKEKRRMKQVGMKLADGWGEVKQFRRQKSVDWAFHQAAGRRGGKTAYVISSIAQPGVSENEQSVIPGGCCQCNDKIVGISPDSRKCVVDISTVYYNAHSIFHNDVYDN